MKTVSVSELKVHLSEKLRAIKSGERLLITERGKPVAELVPPPAVPDQRLAELQADGAIRAGRQKLPLDFWERPRPVDSKGAVIPSHDFR